MQVLEQHTSTCRA